MKNIIKSSLVLFSVSVVLVSLITVVRGLTLEPIAERLASTREAAMRNVLPYAEFFTEIDIEQTGGIIGVFEGFTEDGTAGYVINLTVEGYSGAINLILGISLQDEQISGMRILSHTETPGLGALIVRENFYRRFDGLPLAPLRVVRGTAGAGEIDTITGSTITTRAVVDAVNEGVEFFREVLDYELP